MNDLKEVSVVLDGWIESAQRQFALTDAEVVWLLEQKAMSRYRTYVYRKTIVVNMLAEIEKAPGHH